MEFTLIIIALCSFLAVRSWVKARQKEREAFYRAEAVKKIAEMQGNIPESVLSLLRAGIQESSAAKLWFGPDVTNPLHPAYRRSLIVKTLADMPDSAAAVQEFMREEQAFFAQRWIESCKLGGLVTLGGGIGLLVVLRFVDEAEPIYLAGLIPILVGVALLVYPFLAKPTSA
jgi:hypothetical protein